MPANISILGVFSFSVQFYPSNFRFWSFMVFLHLNRPKGCKHQSMSCKRRMSYEVGYL